MGSEKVRIVLVAAALILLGAAAFSPVLQNGFVEYDDDAFVTENAMVLKGLTAEGVRWAFSTTHYDYWHPLPWISHMADVSLFGLSPRGHHLSSLILHLANVLLLFAILRFVTGAFWRSALVAALFAVHPLQVESVAWVSERKNLLLASFWFLTTGAYALYVRKPSVWRYALMAIFFAFGLTTKPAFVALPVVLLVMDYWPLGRLRRETDGGPAWRHLSLLFLEKIPLLALAAALAVNTVRSQAQNYALQSLENFSFPVRAGNAIVSGAAYLAKAIWPAGLAVFYPHPEKLPPAPQFVAAVIILAAVTAVALHQAKKRPYLLGGWLWYLITLGPMIGVVQVGRQAMADRYAYTSLVGIFLMAAWLMAEAAGSSTRVRRVAVSSMVAVLLIFTVVTRAQTKHWKNTVSLFSRAVDVTEDNWLAHHSLAVGLCRLGKFQESVPHFLEAVRIRDDYAKAHFNLGYSYERLGRRDEAIAQYRAALKIDGNYAKAHYMLAFALLQAGDRNEGERHYREALRLDPGLASGLGR